MPSIELRIGNQKYVVKSDVPDEHLKDVAAEVQRRIDSLLDAQPNTAATKVALLAAVEFCSQAIKGKQQVEDYRGSLLTKAGDILDRIEKELTVPSN